MIDRPIVICLLGSLGLHYALSQGLELLPPLPEPAAPVRITVAIVESPPPPPAPPPEPEKPPEPEAAKPEPTQPVAAKPAPTAQPQIVRERPVETPSQAPPPLAKPTDDDEPVYGVDLSSTSTQGNGPAIGVAHGGGGGGGHTGSGGGPVVKQGGAPKGTGDAPVPAYEATKLPMPQGKCFGKYTDEARAAGTEGTVSLDLTVDEHGRTHDVTVTAGLPNGLSAAALAAARDCVFSPGEKDGKAVAVRLRGFKITFVLEEGR